MGNQRHGTLPFPARTPAPLPMERSSAPPKNSYAVQPGSCLRRWLVPSFSDWLFVALLVWLFMPGAGWFGLLADGDTGWHIRAGEFILQHHALPRHDLFSFSKPGEPWYAWEWLADAAFATVWRWIGQFGAIRGRATDPQFHRPTDTIA